VGFDKAIRITRRRLVGSGAVAIGAGFGAWPLVGRAKTQTLRLLCWSGYNDPEILGAYTNQTGIPVEATPIGANDEIFLKLRAGGLGRYDLVTPQNGVVQGLIDVDLIQPLDDSRLTHAVDYFSVFQQATWTTRGGVRYAAPCLWGSSPLAYNASLVEAPPESWIGVQSDAYRGRVVMFDDGVGHLKVWNRALGAEDPTRVTPEQLERTVQTLMAFKAENVIAFVGKMEDLAGHLVRGDAWVSTIAWEVVPSMAAAKDQNLQITHPLPGDFTFSDNFCLAKSAPSPDAALSFIDYMISPEVQAKLMNKLRRGVVNAKAVPMLDDTSRGLYPYDDLDPFFTTNPLLGFPPFDASDPTIASYPDWVTAWDRVRYAKMA
jgi:spermidine/putrescine transport system substrate-binding protein